MYHHVIADFQLEKRLWGSGDPGSGPRWAFFAILIAIVIIIVLGTIYVNRKRAMRGVKPVYGTQWMTPPNYRQSQTAYQQPSNHPDLPSGYVPTYTKTANENDYDMGYYDAQGVFHRNPNAKSMVQRPPSAKVRDSGGSTSDGGEVVRTSNEGEAGGEAGDLEDISRPAGPPPPRAGESAETRAGENTRRGN
ncbi:uncharacterized protein LODBEIA_P36540 [Lodderomyces beijingensis]|uniref:Protein RCR2 n=1 Tax=Lodderomyces beijingensis TaxID=1775926 RepID=A0ABP0ZMP7_9ASCO